MNRSVIVIGWSTILISVVVILSEILSFQANDPVNQISSLLRAFPQVRSESLESVLEMSRYSRAWSVYTIVYFSVVLVGAVQFVRFRTVGRTILEIACWIGILTSCVDTIMSYVLWDNMKAAMSSLVGSAGTQLLALNPLGLVTIIAGLFLWIVPSIGMIVYLRRPELRTMMK